MPRRPPKALRVRVNRYDHGGRQTVGNELAQSFSPGGVAIIRALERSRLTPGAVLIAIRQLPIAMRWPGAWIDDDDCVYECCPQLHDLRRVAMIAAAALSRRDARVLHLLLQAFDDR